MIIDKLTTNETGMRRSDDFDNVATFLVAEAEQEIRPHDNPFTKEFELSLTIACRFYSTDAGLNHAVDSAKRLLAHQLYEPLLLEIRKLNVAIGNGDRRKAFLITNRMEEMIAGDK